MPLFAHGKINLIRTDKGGYRKCGKARIQQPTAQISRTMGLPAGEADIVLTHDHKAPKAPSPVRKRVHFGFVALHFYHSYRVW